MTQVPWLLVIASAPAIVGTATLVIVMLSTAMKLPAASSSAATHKHAPLQGLLNRWEEEPASSQGPHLPERVSMRASIDRPTCSG